jgi:hypothetical protein
MLSCLCPTYNRCGGPYQYLLEEAVESFLRQYCSDTLLRELVILNDTPGQEVVCDAPRVRVVNLPYRLETLGDKRNLLVELARFEWLAPWDDDDISLPNRVQQACQQMHVQQPDYWKPPQDWYLERGRKPQWKHNVGYRHHSSVFTRAAWRAVGGYARTSGNEDALMDIALMKLQHNIRTYPQGIPPSEWPYLYRWGVSPSHVSGNNDGKYEQRGEEPVAKGCFVLRPYWRQDYTELCRKEL